MMRFEDMGFCGDLDFFSAPLKEGEVEAPQTEHEPVVEDDYSDEEIDVDELEKRLWRDKMRLKRLKEMNKGKEGVDAAKQRQSQEQARRKKMRNRGSPESRQGGRRGGRRCRGHRIICR